MRRSIPIFRYSTNISSVKSKGRSINRNISIRSGLIAAELLVVDSVAYLDLDPAVGPAPDTEA